MKNIEIKLYEKIKEQIKQDILTVKQNTSIGSERKLSEQFNVSRPTIRKALILLENEGYIYKVPQKGYFKKNKEKYVDHELNSFIGLFEDAESQNKKVVSKVIQQTIIKGDKIIANKLNVPIDTELFVLERLRYVENRPMCLVTTYLIPHENLDLSEIDFSKKSLYKKLEETKIKLSRAKRSIEVRSSQFKEQHFLNLSTNEPVFLLESLVFLEDGTPFEYTISKYPGFDVKFETDVNL